MPVAPYPGDSPMTPPPSVRGAARSALTILLVLGLGIAVYLVRHHESQVYGDASVVLANCPQNETVNCELVNTSAWSELFHVPIAAFAIPTYATALVLLWGGLRRPPFLAYVFGIGLLASLYSVFLLWVSSVKIGFVCLWCLRLYGINLALPVLAGVAAWRSPRAMIQEALSDLRLRPATLRTALVTFAALLAVTIGAQQAYRVELKREAAAARARIEQEGGPLVPAVPQGSGESSAVAVPSLGGASGLALAAITPPAPPGAAAATAAPPEAYRLAGPLRRLTAGKGEVRGEPFDLQGRLGKGTPIGLIFWAPGIQASERALVDLSKALRKDAPKLELYAVSGRRDDQRDEEIFEGFAMLGVPDDLPLLVDDKFAVSAGLTTEDVPDLALFSATGALVVAKIKTMDQLLVTDKGNVPAGEIVKRVASGEALPQIKQMHPVYPSAELIGARAPAFTLKKLGSDEMFSFSGKPASGRPALVMFWSPTCKHCQLEIPQLVTWVAAHPGTVDIVGVTIWKRDRPGQPSFRTITQNYVRERGISWTIVEDADGAVADLYENVSTPTTFFVAPSGRVTGVWYYPHPEGIDKPMADELGRLRAAPADLRAVERRAAPTLSMSLMGADGKRIDAASLMDKPAIVHFWATWCKPCVAELPSLLAARASLEKATGGRLVLVSVENEASGKQIAQFAKTLGTAFTSYRAPKGGVYDKIDPSYRVPRTYLVAPGGRVVGSLSGGQDWSDRELAERVRSRLVNSP
jgi:thiol-disulfide isomerase/thioredoxin/uncharacterized membrane protein